MKKKNEETLIVTRTYSDLGQLTSETWRNLLGALHNAEGPASRTFYDNGILSTEKFFEDGQYTTHRPSSVHYFRENGNLETEIFYNWDGQPDRDPRLGPAVIEYDPYTGQKTNEYDYENGELIKHREFCRDSRLDLYECDDPDNWQPPPP